MDVINKEFLNKPTLTVAENLLGMLLCRHMPDESIQKFMINEVEAYDGFDDKASHAHKGKTSRNEIMFGEAGYWYVYLCYGVHWMLNLVTGEKDYPAAILIRGVSNYKGPGILTKQLHITKALNGKFCHPDSGLWIEKNHQKLNFDVITTPRIGVHYAKDWALKPYRYTLGNRNHCKT